MDKEILSAGMVISDDLVYEKTLESLLDAADDIAKKGRSGKAVVNISWGVTNRLHPTYYDMMRKFLRVSTERVGFSANGRFHNPQ